MNRNVLIGIIAAALITLLVAAAFAMNRPTMNDTTSESTIEQSQESKDSTATETTEATDMPVATINYSNSGFSPATLTIQKGTALTIRNESNMDLMFASAEHPTHEDNPELNINTIKPGATGTVTITKAGTWGYHNHSMANHSGKIIVSE